MCIANIPLFRIDVPLSSDSIRFLSELSGSEPDNHVKGVEIFGPSDLSSSKDLSHQKIFKAFVVCNNVDWITGAFKIVLPGFKSLKNGKELFIVSVIIELGGLKSLQ